MDDEQKELRALRRAEARARAAHKRLLEQEREFKRDFDKVRGRVPRDICAALDYIASEIPKRTDAEEVEFLRETRERHFRPYRQRLNSKEDAS